MEKLLEKLWGDVVPTAKQLALLTLICAAIALLVCTPIWGLVWLLGGIH